MTNWADDVIEEEAEDGEEFRSDGDVLGEVTGKARKRVPQEASIPYEERWETDMDAYQALKAHPPTTHFRQAVQMHSDWVNDILLCNYNQTLVTASSDGTIKAWSPHSHGQTPLHEPTVIGSHTDYVRCLTYCREQQWFASGSFDRTIKLWDLATASAKSEPLLTLHPPDAAGPKASVYALATDPYGSVVASGSPERVIRMWDPRSGKRIAKLVGHTDNIRAILISEDAKYLLTGSADASIKLWSLSSQRCLHTFTHHTESVWSLFSSHPALEVFYSGDRSGLVCKVDVEGCADVSEGECIVVCQDAGGERTGSSPGAEGINKIVVMDDNLLWTASGSSSVKRWRLPARRAVRAAALGAEGAVDSPVYSPPPLDSARDYYTSRSSKRNSFDFPSTRTKSPMRSPSVTYEYSRSNSPQLTKSHRASLTPSVASASVSPPLDVDIDPEREGEETWYGIPFDSLVRLSSPNDTGFGLTTRSMRGRDPEIATLYSAASVLSVPRMVRSPLPTGLVQPAPTAAPSALRSASPMRSDTVHSRTRFSEENQTLHAFPRPRAAFDEREVAADAVPLEQEPDEVIHGDHGLVRCVMLNDRVHALTVDTAGEVAVWNVVRGACVGRFPSEDVAAASFSGSDASFAGGSESVNERQRSPREALETVRERIEGEAVVASWSSLDTKTGVLTVHLNEKCFESEIYADEAGYGPERQFGEEARLNIGKWVLRNLFQGFVPEEQKLAARRAREHSSHDHGQHRLQRGSAPTHIDIGAPAISGRSRTSSDVSSRSAASTSVGPRSASIVFAPNMLPAISPSISPAPRSSPLMTPLIPLHGSLRDSALSPIPQSPNTADATPMPRGNTNAQKTDAVTTPAAAGPPSSYPTSGNNDYFSLRTRRGSLSTSGGAPTPDDFTGWGKPASAPESNPMQTPSTPTMGSIMGRLKAFGKSSKRQASEPAGVVTPGGTLTTVPAATASAESVTTPVAKTPAQILLSGPVTPPPSSEAPALPLPPHTSIMISEEAPSGWVTLYRGHLSSTGNDVRQLEEVMPLWVLECLLQNKVPAIPITKISFVLLPYKETEGEQLPELLNTAQSKLTASRFLRVRKLTNHVQDKLERIAAGHHSPGVPVPSSTSAAATPRSSFDARSMSSGRTRSDHHSHSSGEPRPRAEDQYEILCNDVVLPLDMTLAAVRQFVWRQSSELVMHYRRKRAPAQLSAGGAVPPLPPSTH
ncbi:hypothetical protein C8Q77DRAFT_1061553 [Trametes polyzona]|nr:hypothetical protein C8Q77DRAFT_1061553 [Trametes polyzona]